MDELLLNLKFHSLKSFPNVYGFRESLIPIHDEVLEPEIQKCRTGSELFSLGGFVSGVFVKVSGLGDPCSFCLL